jgi:hypothetical protein
MNLTKKVTVKDIRSIKMKKTRSGKAGILLAKAIVEMINLMYQKDTAYRFITSLIVELEAHKYMFKRKKEEDNGS